MFSMTMNMWSNQRKTHNKCEEGVSAYAMSDLLRFDDVYLLVMYDNNIDIYEFVSGRFLFPDSFKFDPGSRQAQHVQKHHNSRSAALVRIPPKILPTQKTTNRTTLTYPRPSR